MENKIQIFENAMFGTVRTIIGENGEPWFVGKEVAEILGYVNVYDALIHLVDKEDSKVLIYKASRKTREASLWQGNDFSNKTLINESGLYSLILSSKLEKARAFKHWVTAEVLPQIRMTGGYIPIHEGDDDQTITARTVAILKETLKKKDAIIAQQQKKVLFADAISSCKSSILIRDLAKLITQNGHKIGQARLFYWLRLHGYIFQQETRPIQKWVEAGIFDTSITMKQDGNGKSFCCTTKVTAKGQRYFIEGFKTGKFHAENGNF